MEEINNIENSADSIDLSFGEASSMDDLYALIRRVYNSEGRDDDSVRAEEIIRAIEEGDFDSVPQDFNLRTTAEKFYKQREDSVTKEV